MAFIGLVRKGAVRKWAGFLNGVATLLATLRTRRFGCLLALASDLAVAFSLRSRTVSVFLTRACFCSGLAVCFFGVDLDLLVAKIFPLLTQLKSLQIKKAYY